MFDPHEALGVSNTASIDEIKHAYRRLAMKFHPDRVNVADKRSYEEKFKDIQRAYSMLSERSNIEDDSETEYEEQEDYSEYSFEDLPEIDGEDIFIDAFFTLEEAIHGVKKLLSFTFQENCIVCEGSGVRPGTASVECLYCNGTGEINREKNKEVKVPPGIVDGIRIRCGDLGKSGLYGGINGDLYFVVHLMDHEIFKRDGLDLYCTIEVDQRTLRKGGSITVNTLDGVKMVTVPPKTDANARLRLQGHGLKNIKDKSRGDLYLVIQLVRSGFWEGFHDGFFGVPIPPK